MTTQSLRQKFADKISGKSSVTEINRDYFIALVSNKESNHDAIASNHPLSRPPRPIKAFTVVKPKEIDTTPLTSEEPMESGINESDLEYGRFLW